MGPESAPVAGQVVAAVFWVVVLAGLVFLHLQSRKDRP